MIIKNENFNKDNKIIKEYSYKRVFVSFIFALLTQIYLLFFLSNKKRTVYVYILTFQTKIIFDHIL